MEHPINGLLDVTMQKIREMIDVNTIIGDAITTSDGMTIIPVSKLSVGFGSGGSDHGAKGNDGKSNFGGGSGAGISITPILFLVVGNGQVRTIPVDTTPSNTDKLLGNLPEIINTVSSLFKKDKDKCENTDIKQNI